MREMTAFEHRLAAECAARHRTPVAQFDHPKGVIVPYDTLLTENIRNDRDYVPYCGPCVPMQRMRRTADGFICPTCKNHSNWDLTPFNHNVDVQFDPEYVDPVWLAEHQKTVQAIRDHEALHKETYTEFKQREEEKRARNWDEDRGKKNTSDHPCNKCGTTFFGKKSRKYCRRCQGGVTQHLQTSPWTHYVQTKRGAVYSHPNREERRGG